MCECVCTCVHYTQHSITEIQVVSMHLNCHGVNAVIVIGSHLYHMMSSYYYISFYKLW